MLPIRFRNYLGTPSEGLLNRKPGLPVGFWFGEK